MRLETGLFSENRQYIYPSYRVQDSQMGSVIQRAKSWTMEPDVRGVECCFLIGASRCGRSQVVDWMWKSYFEHAAASFVSRVWMLMYFGSCVFAFGTAATKPATIK